MNLQHLLQGKSDCICGRHHVCEIPHVHIGTGALTHLAEICAPFSHILLISDENTDVLCGSRVRALLGDKLAACYHFGAQVVVPNEDAIAQIEGVMPHDTDLVVGIGSGVINDLCKYVSFLHGIRYAIIATAPSMDGYASVGAALILEEMKITKNARVPYAILAERDVLCTAPIEMIQAGYGDIVGKYSCLCDWRVAHLLHGEYFCDFVHDTVLDTVHRIEGLAPALLARDGDAVCALMEALVVVGIMMSYVDNSRPASGSEHHLSHFFEITGLLHDRPYYPHGIDVLYSAAVTAQLREQICALQPPFASFIDDRTVREEELRRIYTSAADGILALQDKVGFYADCDTALFAQKWQALCELLRDAPDYASMCDYVQGIGLNMDAFYAFYGHSVIADAVRYAKDLKDRYTILWIAYALGIE